MMSFKVVSLRLLQWFFPLIVLSGCDRVEGTTFFGDAILPVVTLQCEIPNCSSTVNSTSALVILTKSGCESDFEVVASSTASFNCVIDGCEGTTPGWADSNGDSITTTTPGAYELCVLVDEDNSGNGSYTSGDIVFEEQVTLSGADTLTADGSGWRVVN